MSQTTTPRPVYNTKFSADEADIVCISADGERFRMSSFVLRTASGFFRSTLSLPASGQIIANSPETDPIFLSEPGIIVERLFSVICGLGISPSSLETLDDVVSLLHAADKYDMPGVVSFIQAIVSHPRFMKEHPLSIYQLSCRYCWVEEAKLASTHTLGIDLLSTEPNVKAVVESLQSKDLLALLHLRQRRLTAFKETLHSFAGSQPQYTCTGQNCGHPVKPHAWLLYQATILEEFSRDPTGTSVTTYDFWDTVTARAAFDQTCRRQDCGKQLFDREMTLRDVRLAIDQLPCTI